MRDLTPKTSTLLDIAILLGLACFTQHHLPLGLVFSDSLTVGGDTPAHSYLASQLRDTLFGHGRIISWSQGWWCGFPMFQFYFPLPYILVVILDLVMPFNIAFKLVTVAGIFSLPPIAYLSARVLKLKSPTPILVAIVSLLFLFCDTHTMWGANIYSMLSGMIANAFGFPLMLLSLAIWWRDADRGRGSALAVICFGALILTHFFTAIMATITALCLPLLQPARNRKGALQACATNAIYSAMLTAWWWLPLFAKRRFSADYGSNWDVELLNTLPIAVWVLFPAALAGLYVAVRKRSSAVAMMVWFTLAATFLFSAGYGLSAVFVNIRLWPFIFYGLLFLSMAGLGALLNDRYGARLGTLALLTAVLMRISDEQQPQRQNPPPIRTWATQNYSGFEKQPGYAALQPILTAIDGTPGRLAFDYSLANDAFGSPRILEAIPHLVNKAIIEGGIVNSSPMSDHAYYARCLTSARCTGHSALMNPTSFDLSRATPRLEWMNVKHFIARWQYTQEAMHASDDWTWLASSGPLELFELNTHAGQHVVVPAYEPVFVQTDSPDAIALQWTYCDALVEQPVALVGSPQDAPSRPGLPHVLSAADFLRLADTNTAPCTTDRPQPDPRPLPAVAVVHEGIGPVDEAFSKDGREFRFSTDAIGRPHIIKISFYPNWKVSGAERIYRVSPMFMLVYPTQRDVVIRYGSTASDHWGRGMTATGLIAFLVHGVSTRRRKPLTHSHPGSPRASWFFKALRMGEDHR